MTYQGQHRSFREWAARHDPGDARVELLDYLAAYGEPVHAGHCQFCGARCKGNVCHAHSDLENEEEDE